MSVHGPQPSVYLMVTDLTKNGAIDLSLPPSSAQALIPETDVHIYSTTHTVRGPAVGNGAVWTSQSKADLLNDFIWLLSSLARRWSSKRQSGRGNGSPEWQT